MWGLKHASFVDTIVIWSLWCLNEAHRNHTLINSWFIQASRHLPAAWLTAVIIYCHVLAAVHGSLHLHQLLLTDYRVQILGANLRNVLCVLPFHVILHYNISSNLVILNMVSFELRWRFLYRFIELTQQFKIMF